VVALVTKERTEVGTTCIFRFNQPYGKGNRKGPKKMNHTRTSSPYIDLVRQVQETWEKKMRPGKGRPAGSTSHCHCKNVRKQGIQTDFGGEGT